VKNNLQNRKFGRLTPIVYTGTLESGHAAWLCRCDCGNEKIIRSASLISGLTKSCGCLQKEIARKSIIKSFTTHGMSKSPEYHSWTGMKRRCYYSKGKDYKDYGQRGIRVCDRWVNSFDNFLTDMGLRPSAKHSLNRIDNDGNYCLENCKWSTQAEQQQNRFRVTNISDEIIKREFYKRFTNK
jgi:hypothetical protein